MIDIVGENIIKDYYENIYSLKSYIDKLKSGDFSSSDELSLANEFSITGDSVEELTKKIQEIIDSELDSILKQIDDILNNAYKTNNISLLNTISQPVVNKNENALLNLLDKINLYSNNVKIKTRKCAILAELNTRLAYYGLKPIAKPV